MADILPRGWKITYECDLSKPLTWAYKAYYRNEVLAWTGSDKPVRFAEYARAVSAIAYMRNKYNKIPLYVLRGK